MRDAATVILDAGSEPPCVGCILWEHPAPGFGQVSIDSKGQILVPLETGMLALDKNGNEQWFFDAGGHARTATIPENGDIAFTIASGNLFILNSEGELKSSIPIQGFSHFSPAALASGSIAVATDEGYLTVVTSEGEVEFDQKMSEYLVFNGSPAIGCDDHILLADSGARIHAVFRFPLYTPMWSTLWRTLADEFAFPAVFAPPSIDAFGNVFLTSWSGSIASINSCSTRQPTMPVEHYVAAGSEITIGADGTLYMASTDDVLHAVQPDGIELWAYDMGPSTPIFRGSATISQEGTLYISSASGQVHALNPDGSTLWMTDIGGEATSSITLGANGTLYARTPTKVVALHTQSTGIADSAWPMPGHDVRQTRRTSACDPKPECTKYIRH